MASCTSIKPKYIKRLQQFSWRDDSVIPRLINLIHTNHFANMNTDQKCINRVLDVCTSPQCSKECCVLSFVCLSVGKTCFCGLKSTLQAKRMILIFQMNTDKGKLDILDTVECSWTPVSADIFNWSLDSSFLKTSSPSPVAWWQGSLDLFWHILISVPASWCLCWICVTVLQHLRDSADYAKHLFTSQHLFIIRYMGSEQSVGHLTSQHGWYVWLSQPQSLTSTRALQGCTLSPPHHECWSKVGAEQGP